MLRTARRSVQILLLGFFFLLLLLARYPFENPFPVQFFLTLDPLVVFSACIAARALIPNALPALILLVLTAFAGRFFCGWICPLGTSLDASDGIMAKASRSNTPEKTRLRWIKYGIWIAIVSASIFSIQLAGFLDPMSLFTRTAVTVLYPVFVYFTDGWIGLMFSVGFLEDTAFRINQALQSLVLPVHAVLFRGSIFIAAMFLIILVLGHYQKRFWCRNLCPLGAMLGLFSLFRLYRRRVDDTCTECGLCHRSCRMGAITKDVRKTDHTECINCMDCQAICPVHAIHFDLRSTPSAAPVDLSRRRILGAGASGIAALGLLRVGFRDSVSAGKVVRPPASLEEAGFLDRCVRCGECIRICSTSGAGLHFTALESGWEGLGTPQLLTPAGYCEYNCNLCGQVCPTGAIHPVTVDEKHRIKMGTAHFNKATCIPWYYGENCMVCEEHCPVPEKAIQFVEKEITTIDGRMASVLLPYVREDRCIGCGICTWCCPLTGDKGITLNHDGEQRWPVQEG